MIFLKDRHYISNRYMTTWHIFKKNVVELTGKDGVWTYHSKRWSAPCTGRVARERSVLLYAASMQWESVFQQVSSLHSLNKSFKITAASCVGFPLQIWSLKHRNVGVSEGLKVKTMKAKLIERLVPPDKAVPNVAFGTTKMSFWVRILLKFGNAYNWT